VIDQPSQVYFPRKLAVRKDETPDEPELKDDDIDAVRAIFGTIGKVVGAAQGEFQVILLDHAPSTVWGDQPYLHQAAEWRDGIQKLVPLEWL
jgi:hypothetical protein